MRCFRSLRVRLTAVFVVGACGALALAATATILWTEQAILGRVDAVLLEEATTLANLIDLPPKRLIQAVRRVGSERDLGPGKFISINGPDGSILAASHRRPMNVGRRQPTGLSVARVISAGEDDALFRVAWAPTKTGGAVAIGVHTSHEVRLVQRTRWAVSVVAGLLLVALGWGAWAIIGRAIYELDRLAAEVATVEAGSLERRLSVRRTDEVNTLVCVLNRVLGRLERSVAELRRFTADAAHELRTPLTALRARLELALYQETESVPRDVVVDALEQTERLARLAEDLLTLARVEGGAVAQAAMEGAVDLSALVLEVATELEPIAEEQERDLRSSIEPGLWVKGAEPLLKRVLVNLMDNAFRHTPASARIEIAARHEGRNAVMEVYDAGPGIDGRVFPHLFERFHHGAGGGSGLGLALVREIVERHGGTVTLQQPHDGGTRARIVVPLIRDPRAV